MYQQRQCVRVCVITIAQHITVHRLWPDKQVSHAHISLNSQYASTTH